VNAVQLAVFKFKGQPCVKQELAKVNDKFDLVDETK
jgi:hypothetical protein